MLRFKRRAFHTLTATTLLASSALLTGCIVSGSKTIRTQGTRIGAHTFAQIHPGQTDKAWVLAVLGEPTRKSTLDRITTRNVDSDNDKNADADADTDADTSNPSDADADSAHDSDHEVWVWVYRRIKHHDTDVLFIFDGSSRTESTQRVYIEFAGDTVARAWRD